jgi:hypothetical protein
VKKLLSTLIIGLAITSLAAACGGDKKAATKPDPATTEPKDEETPAAESGSEPAADDSEAAGTDSGGW